MVQLEEGLLVGKGLHRDCFRHPNNAALCIKVVYNGNQDESRREQAYYRRLANRNIDWRMLPRYHGEVDTNRGRGDMFELVRDFDGKPARTLEFYLQCEQRTAAHHFELESALARLRHYLLEQCVVTMTLKPKNIVFRRQRKGGGDLVIVDNIGHADFLPLCDYLPAFARRKIRRKWNRFEGYLLKLFPSNDALREIVDAGAPPPSSQDSVWSTSS